MESIPTYKCPVCPKRTLKSKDMCTHMLNAHLYFEKHTEWIESHGINYFELCGLKDGKLGKGTYKPLMEVVEAECKDDKVKWCVKHKRWDEEPFGCPKCRLEQ